MTYEIGILDQSPVFEAESTEDAITHTIQLAKQAEQWGYKRFWVAEHHHMEQIAGVSPEILISYILAQTTTINIGSGGVMLQHYSPYKVAENFHLLANLSPGRVDMGIGKAPGGFHLSTKGLQYDGIREHIDFETRVKDLDNFIKNQLPKTHPLSGLVATPVPSIKPELYLLGGSENSAGLAAELDAHFVFAQFLKNNEETLKQTASIHHQRNKRGKLVVAVAVLAADTEAEAKELAKDVTLFEIIFDDGRTLKVQSLNQVEALTKQTNQSFTVHEKKVSVILGTEAQVKAVLHNLHITYNISEFILHTPLRNKKARLRSFELLRPESVKEEVALDINERLM